MGVLPGQNVCRQRRQRVTCSSVFKLRHNSKRHNGNTGQFAKGAFQAFMLIGGVKQAPIHNEGDEESVTSEHSLVAYECPVASSWGCSCLTPLCGLRDEIQMWNTGFWYWEHTKAGIKQTLSRRFHCSGRQVWRMWPPGISWGLPFENFLLKRLFVRDTLRFWFWIPSLVRISPKRENGQTIIAYSGHSIYNVSYKDKNGEKWLKFQRVKLGCNNFLRSEQLKWVLKLTKSTFW